MAVGGAAPVAYYPFACCPNPPVESPAFRYLVNAALLMWEIQTLPFDRGFAVLERESIALHEQSQPFEQPDFF